MTDGLLLIDKPGGMTSMAVTRRIKRLLDVKKAGHLGTLDPLATGLLPMMVGKATKLGQFFEEGDKTYIGSMRLGQVTDTLDSEGQLLEEHDPQGISLEDVTAAAKNFQGEIPQVPPMHSAIKHQGKPLYQLARQGREIERKARTITIYALEILGLTGPDADFEVTCSKGTYVRTLVHDLGRKLGCGAHLTSLRRTRQGLFSIDDALALKDLKPEQAIEALIPLHECLPDWPEIQVDEDQQLRLKDGMSIPADEFQMPRTSLGIRYRMVSERLVALAETHELEGDILLKPIKVFI